MPLEPNSIRSLRNTAIVATLQQCRMFAGLGEAELEAIAEGCVVRSLEKGEVLFREGDTADGFYVVRTGTISVQRVTQEGREQIICLFGPGESFAEAALATVEVYPANAVALENSQVILVRKREFTALIHRRPELSLRMLGSMSIHLKHLVQLLQDLKGRQVEARLADWLLKQEAVRADDCMRLVKLSISKKVLAGQLGVTSETLSRTFAKFREQGLVAVEGPKVRILDDEGLLTHARSS